MASTAQKRLWWADWRCNPLKMKTVAFPGPDRDWNLPVADAAVPAFQLFASLMRRHNYLFREVSGGTYNCRKIAGTDAWSLHAYGIAIDLNPSVNKFGTTQHDYPQGFIDDVLATGLFKWLHTFDPMHWEIDVPPSQIEEENMEELVKRIQEALNEAGLTPVLTVDGVWGEKTKNRFIAGLNLGSGAKGDKGDKGDRGPKGDPGADGTLIVRGTKEI